MADEFGSDFMTIVDEDGTEYECPVKPARASDKIFLKMLLR